MKNIFLLYSVIIFSLIIGCKKETLIPKVVNELEFTCPHGDVGYPSHLEGTIDGNNFCYHDEVEGYEKYISITSGFRTDEPYISSTIDTNNVSNFRVWANLGFIPTAIWNLNSPIGIIPNLKHYILIETPADTENKPLSDMIKNSLLEVGNLPIQNDKVGSKEGFNIVFRFNDDNANISQIFEARGGKQDGSYLKITELEITDFPGGTHYEVTFEFSCNLYYYGDPKKFYAKLENGKMKLSFDI